MVKPKLTSVDSKCSKYSIYITIIGLLCAENNHIPKNSFQEPLLEEESSIGVNKVHIVYTRRNAGSPSRMDKIGARLSKALSS